MEAYVNIWAMHKQGYSMHRIAKELKMSRNTVRKYLRNKEKYPNYNLSVKRGSYLDGFKDYINTRIQAAKPEWIPATVLLKEIQDKGYKGKISILREYIKQFKEVNTPKPIIRFETEPGRQMQIDFVTVSNRNKHFKAFVATLGYSRASYVKFFNNEKSESWLLGLKEAFEYFKGVPKEVLCDNAKALIIERDAYGEGEHKYNASFLDMSKNYGFRIKACRPYRPQSKGKVERFNSYLKHSFIIPLITSYKQNGLEVDIDILNSKVGPWLKDEANKRVHGSTNAVPADLLRDEQFNFLALPAVATTVTVEVKKSTGFDIQPNPDIFDALLTKEIV